MYSDIDECKNKPCDSLSTDCINLNGSYLCKCKSGFIRLTGDVCQSNFSNWFFLHWTIFHVVYSHGIVQEMKQLVVKKTMT